MPQKNQGKIDPRLNVCLDDLVEIKRLDDVPDEDGPSETVYQSIQVLSRAHTTATAMT